MTSRNRIQSRQIRYYNYTRLMSVVPKTAGLISPGGMQTPLFPGDRICCPVWVGGLLKLLKTCYNGSSVMVHMLASTWNEPSHPVERTHARLSVWRSPQSSLATGPCFVSPQDHDVTELDTVLPNLVLQLHKANECGAKNCRVSIPRWDANPPFPWGQNLLPTMTSRGHPQESSLRYPTHLPGWTLMDACIKWA
jgi:hypothetical protein